MLTKNYIVNRTLTCMWSFGDFSIERKKFLRLPRHICFLMPISNLEHWGIRDMNTSTTNGDPCNGPDEWKQRNRYQTCTGFVFTVYLIFPGSRTETNVNSRPRAAHFL